MNTLFEPVRIQNLELKNRFVRSATFEGCGDHQGNPTQRLITLYEALGRGGVGLIITGIVYVHPSGAISPIQTSLAGDDHIPAWQRVTRAVHQQGAAVAAQLFHAGLDAGRMLQPLGREALAPSRKDHPLFPFAHRAMTDAEIQELVRAFGEEADFISMSRPLIREPHLIRDWERGDRRRPACISCNKCLEALRKRTPLHCVMAVREEARNL